MEFLGIGYQELLVVLVLLLVVVGPERLPNVAYQIGRAVRTMQQYARQVRDEFSEEISYLEEQVAVVKGEVESARVAMQSETAQMNAEIRQATDSLREPLRLEPPHYGREPEATSNVVQFPANTPASEAQQPAADGTTPTEAPVAAPPPPPTSSSPPLLF